MAMQKHYWACDTAVSCILPQAADLAEKSAERTVRVASCEFLHASILWMVGTNARRYTL